MLDVYQELRYLFSYYQYEFFLPTLTSGNKYSKRKSNPWPQPLYAYLSGPTFLANLTPPNKESF